MSTYEKDAVRAVLDAVRTEGRTALTAPEGKRITDAYGIPTPAEGLAESADDAVALADRIGFPVVLKVVSPDISHKTDAGGVRVGLGSSAEVRGAYTAIVANARAYAPTARIQGVQVQQMVPGGGQEVIVGAVTDPTFGKVVAFGLGGVLVEVLKDITFRLAPASRDDALSMLDGIRAAEVLRGVRGGAAGSHTGALAGDDAVYDDILRQAGVLRAPGLNEMLEYARTLPVLPGVGRGLVGWLSDYWGRKTTLVFVIVVLGLAQFGVIWAGNIRSEWLFPFFAFLSGFGGGAFYPMFAALTPDYFGENDNATNYGLVYSGKLISGLFGGGLGSMVVDDWGYDGAYALAGGISMLAAAVALLLRQPGRTRVRDIAPNPQPISREAV
ncbi:MFS transporter [Streptomyces sp. BRA346]|uniref:MFS transporter n=1 Tax=Streptomyces sp. BRA346 TaxID=2878199 RepID=UPI004062B88E